jgi:hypothetical protein
MGEGPFTRHAAEPTRPDPFTTVTDVFIVCPNRNRLEIV